MSAEPLAGDALDSLFAALADPTRRQLLQRLLAKGPATATVLSEPLPVSRQAVVKHLQAMEEPGSSRRSEGREVRYRATPERLASAVGWLLDAGGSWTVASTGCEAATDDMIALAHGQDSPSLPSYRSSSGGRATMLRKRCLRDVEEETAAAAQLAATGTKHA